MPKFGGHGFSYLISLVSRQRSAAAFIFEAGFAMGLGVPVIWTARSTSINDLHFDTRQYNHIVWDTPTELYEKLLARIGAVMGGGPLLSIG